MHYLSRDLAQTNQVRTDCQNRLAENLGLTLDFETTSLHQHRTQSGSPQIYIKMVNFSIEVVSDTLCPWCYVGHHHLASAITTFQRSSPTYPGISKEAMYASKFPPQILTQIRARLNFVGATAGIKFAHGGQTGNTRDSHILIHLINKTFGSEAQNKVIGRIFKRYFEEEGNPTDIVLLAKWATESGVPGLKENLVKRWLGLEGEGGEAEVKLRKEGEEAGEIVDREARWASNGGISGVPEF
ncbi:hypothetical protein BGX38DRAFT_1140742 [Terfezia claveryi]|nr:hypothetical protein BGX38DRAFT_1140742 [Terfezia claveryi]